MATETNGQAPIEQTAPTEKPKRKTHPLTKAGRKARHRSTKAEIDREKVTAKVIACLACGKSIKETSAELDISEDWVVRVRKELPEDFIASFTAAKTNEISELIEQGLKAQLLAMIKMVEVTNDELWLKAQRAPELATFFGVVNDKTVRILAAIERADERARSEREELRNARAFVPSEPTQGQQPREATQGA